MEYQIGWSSKAVSDLGEHVAFIRKAPKEAAAQFSSKVIAVVLSLSSFPERFSEFPMPNKFPFAIRNCVVDGHYNILYGIINETVMIYRILDARRKFDGLIR